MQEFYPFLRVALLSLLINYSQAQTLTARPGVSMAPVSHGFYEYLPQGYSTSSSQTYPLMIFFHGSAEVGNGTSDLPNVLRNGPPKLINQGTFPTSFTVNGHTYSFIMLIPQSDNWASWIDVDSMINYAERNYKVDVNRIYLTGLSMGGSPVWDYPASSVAHAQRVAAILPVAGAYGLYQSGPQNIASGHLPVFATHNLNDPTVSSDLTINNVALVNNSTNPAPNPKARDSIFNVSGHDAWTTTYNPNINMIDGMNVYEWLLTNQRNVTIPLPVKLASYSARAVGGTAVVEWTTAMEDNNRYFILERSGDGQSFAAIDTIAAAGHGGGGASYRQVDERPGAGVNFYRLSQVDLDGKTTWFDVLTVSFAAASSALRLSPNPSPGLVYMEMSGAAAGLLKVRLSDQQGKVLKNWSFTKQAGSWKQALDPGSIPPGVYIITIEGKGLKEVRQFIRQ
ncbi:MAG: T9SS type A sorting domain-containing protein [Bacteroidetes bacterium]|nr:T9SS type A sorting domain-containing protein [Bacteroidota bacterium]